MAGRVRYPDAFVVCTPLADRATVVTDPVAIFEVLSDSSENDDLVVKNAEYRATQSVRYYIILEQTRIGAIVFLRKGDDWVTTLLTDGTAAIDLPDVGVHIPLEELYAGLESGSAPSE